MHIKLAEAIADKCRRRLEEGDCPTTAAPSPENLEFAVVSLSGALLQIQDELQAVGEEFGVEPGERRIDGIRRVLSELRNRSSPPATPASA